MYAQKQVWSGVKDNDESDDVYGWFSQGES